jgi:hypothetical protein
MEITVLAACKGMGHMAWTWFHFQTFKTLPFLPMRKRPDQDDMVYILTSALGLPIRAFFHDVA